MKVKRGQAGTRHVVAWWLLNFRTWLFPSSPRVRLLAKHASGTTPNGVNGVPCDLPARTEIRGFGCPVIFLLRITEAKTVR